MKLEFPNIKFNRNEFAGSFGDIGTDFPLIVGMILASGLDVTSVLVMFGSMQILTGLIYGMPMPVQPLKAMAALVIAQKISGNILYGAGLAIGLVMLVLSLTELITYIVKIVPKSVVRGIQFGLGLQLAILALKDYVASDALGGYMLAGVSFLFIILLMNNKKCPPALLVVLSGVLYAMFFKIDFNNLSSAAGFHLPMFHVPSLADIATGFVILALPQLPLSICNSLVATNQMTKDLFPDKPLTVKKIGLTYSLMNVINPFLGGIPVCHGSGGMAGHYFFGARTGGSVIIYGMLYLVIGLFLSQGFGEVIKFFPKPVLGIILMFEGVALMSLIRDVEKNNFMIIFIVGLAAVCLPYGYLAGLCIGILLSKIAKFS